MTAFKSILCERKGNIGYVTLNRPEMMNAMNLETICVRKEAFAEMEKDQEVLGVIITGAAHLHNKRRTVITKQQASRRNTRLVSGETGWRSKISIAQAVEVFNSLSNASYISI